LKLYGGIDLHSNNSVIVILDEADKVVYQKQLNNDLRSILEQLSVYKGNDQKGQRRLKNIALSKIKLL